MKRLVLIAAVAVTLMSAGAAGWDGCGYSADLIDASDWLDKEDFDDGHHVLKTGADKFSTRMIDEVQKLLARTEPSEQQHRTPKARLSLFVCRG